MDHRTRRSQLAALLAAAALAGCHDLPSDLEAYCNDTPMAAVCPVGVCSGPYECIDYCIQHFPEHEAIPGSGLGAWCDDLGTPTTYGPFCTAHPDVASCPDWCELHPGQCGATADGDADVDVDGDADADSDADADEPPVCEGRPCTTGETVSCVTTCGTPGIRACVDCDWDPTCTPLVETCNDTDDDCDGEVDNGFECRTGETTTCTTTCGTEGTTACDAETCSWATCVPPVEVCDGIDQDCSGAADEGCACAEGWVEEILPEEPAVMFDFWAAAWNDIHAVGSAGVLFHFDGASWSRTKLTDTDLNGVWGSSSNDVYAVGNLGVVAHYDGVSWTQVSSPTSTNLNSVAGASSSFVVAVGADGIIINFDGTEWRPADSPIVEDLSGVWCANEADCTAVGDVGTVVRFADGEWVAQPAITSADLFRVHGSSDNNVWAVGETLVHFDGTEWTEDPSISGWWLSGIRVISDDRAFVVGLRGGVGEGGLFGFDGASWTRLITRTSSWVISVEATTDDNVFAAGGDLTFTEPFILHRCGSGW